MSLSPKTVLIFEECGTEADIIPPPHRSWESPVKRGVISATIEHCKEAAPAAAAATGHADTSAGHRTTAAATAASTPTTAATAAQAGARGRGGRRGQWQQPHVAPRLQARLLQ